ncbi:MAG: hypothetical protein ACREAU_01270 [Nitrosopumilaceae archaeon]
MKRHKPTKANNLVAKYTQRCGAGEHTPKQGKHVPRCKDKHMWQQEVDSQLRNSYNL